MHFLHFCRKLVHISCHKGAGTKMHKYLVGSKKNYEYVNEKDDNNFIHVINVHIFTSS